jgi:hypothetical protein
VAAGGLVCQNAPVIATTVRNGLSHNAFPTGGPAGTWPDRPLHVWLLRGKSTP